MAKQNKKQNAVRMLEQAIRLTKRTTVSRVSGRATGRSEKEMNKYLAVLKRLECDDPDSEEYWDNVHKVVGLIVRCLRDIDR
jgi:hypothetical protein